MRAFHLKATGKIDNLNGAFQMSVFKRDFASSIDDIKARSDSLCLWRHAICFIDFMRIASNHSLIHKGVNL